jgi:hypothetical protein
VRWPVRRSGHYKQVAPSAGSTPARPDRLAFGEMMTNEIAATACPPHHWEVTLLHLQNGLHDHYRCLRCAAEKDVPRGQTSTSWRPTSGRPRRVAS